ncbi:hypothetical protein BJ508DRAFT_320509 [Ascobolus immersus RN42]|uniref:PAS domain-containing protein n=1 Tax=Ascobolus immersus RN42 TaxID=1160509 RepID=A0A3N4IP32_ASCIM|nr:hypothetical protein BJ508DRAFT_320509 [Ascobolus immersus RN42]
MAAPVHHTAEELYASHEQHEEEKMENQTFISMHELHDDAKIVYISESVQDLLGYEPSEVIGKSPFDFFIGEQAAAARRQHGRGVKMDKAAVLTKWNLRAKNGEIIPCECVFTVVYSVVVAATSLLRKDTYDSRKKEAVEIANQFNPQPQAQPIPPRNQDPRTDMINLLSAKFISPPNGQNEPRAALFLNRFTRSLCILYSTEAVTDMLGISPEDLAGKSFLECIDEQDVMRATEVIERAKENDSITYLRFRWRDPRGPVVRRRLGSTQESRIGATHANGNHSRATANGGNGNSSSTRITNQNGAGTTSRGNHQEESDLEESTDEEDEEEEEEEVDPEEEHVEEEEDDDDDFHTRRRPPPMFQAITVECVISCTSDGLVAVLRRSRALEAEHAAYAPWALHPVVPSPSEPTLAGGDFMECIRQIAAFAWNCAAIQSDVRQYAKRNKDYDYAHEYSDGLQIRPSHSANGGSIAGPSNSSNETVDQETNGNVNGSTRSAEGGNKRKRA